MKKGAQLLEKSLKTYQLSTTLKKPRGEAEYALIKAIASLGASSIWSMTYLN
jgi:hypothetical protein